MSDNFELMLSKYIAQTSSNICKDYYLNIHLITQVIILKFQVSYMTIWTRDKC